ncbi:MAG: hypothetical protein A3C35_05510 [Omnitrophica bacterium RIFCSPHIGHO2_02_FULL_46_11]|nr:MAG: hypothetical protein A3C35_05510 [Omnitrophica bacterium RIFCSPHIGHO2_02_FULL_46_11]OGW87969.1 MAG: hypothetical protein A3A81_06675 [Omnitrophica bacterium RIFCSPLOWO2_01_FULL_45_10b]
MSRGYETFEHTADIGIRAWGSEFSEVFEEAAKALFNVMVDLNTVSVREHLTLELTAESGEELFLKWLKELLFIFDTKHLLLSEFKIRDLGPQTLQAQVGGEPLDNAKHELGREVKAITLHQFKLIQEQSRYFTEVILDI